MRRAPAGQGTWEVSQSSWAMLASPSRALAATGTANSGSGQRGGSLSSPRVPSRLPVTVWKKAIATIAAKSRPTTSRVAALPHRSLAQTRAAGKTSITPSRATARSITVTKPKSRSILMSLAISTAKPAVAVTPDASTAAPVRA